MTEPSFSFLRDLLPLQMSDWRTLLESRSISSSNKTNSFCFWNLGDWRSSRVTVKATQRTISDGWPSRKSRLPANRQTGTRKRDAQPACLIIAADVWVPRWAHESVFPSYVKTNVEATRPPTRRSSFFVGRWTMYGRAGSSFREQLPGTVDNLINPVSLSL